MKLFENKSQLPANYYSQRIVDDLRHVYVLLKYIPGKIEESTVTLLDLLDDIKTVESYISGMYRTPRTLREFAINVARRLHELGLLEDIVNVEIDMKNREAVFYIDGKQDKAFQFRDVAKSIGYPMEILKLEKFKDDPLKMYVLKFKFEQAAGTDKDAEPEVRVPEVEEEMKYYFTCPNDGTEFEIEIKPIEGEKELQPIEPSPETGEVPKESIQLECKLCGYTDTIVVPLVGDNLVNQVKKVVPVCTESANQIIYDYKRTKDPLFIMRKYSLLPEHIVGITNILQESVKLDTNKTFCPVCDGIVFEKEEKLECQNCSYSFTEDVPIEPGDLFKDEPMDPEKWAKELISKATGYKPPYTVADLQTIKKVERQCFYCNGSLTEAGAFWCTSCGYILTEQGHAPIIQICPDDSIYDPMLGKCISKEEFAKPGEVPME